MRSLISLFRQVTHRGLKSLKTHRLQMGEKGYPYRRYPYRLKGFGLLAIALIGLTLLIHPGPEPQEQIQADIVSSQQIPPSATPLSPLGAPSTGTPKVPKPPSEIRGVWITNVASNVLFAPWGIPRAINQLADMHFNTVYPVVWNRGKTFYHSPTLKQLTGQPIEPLMALTHPTEDPLREMVRLGHRKQLRVIPWFEYGFMVPLNSKLARQHPDWLTTRQNGSFRLQEETFEAAFEEGANDKAAQKKTPRGLAKLLNSGAPTELGWLNPLHPSVQALMLNLAQEVVSQYDVDGIQFDDHFSLPVDFGYDPYTVSLYRAEHQGQSPPTNPADEDWIRWRAGKLSSFVKDLHSAVKTACPTCLISLSPNPAKFAYRFHLQDWRTWVENDWLDELVVQVYRDDLYRFEGELAKNTLQATMDRIPVSIGILTGTWRRPISFEQIQAQVVSSRNHHFSGVSFFYWETLWSYFTPESPQQRRRNFRALLEAVS
ncbi:MAG: family 10 glycosylhydrolase [Cyanobacteria bacterium J06554_11]